MINVQVRQNQCGVRTDGSRDVCTGLGQHWPSPVLLLPGERDVSSATVAARE